MKSKRHGTCLIVAMIALLAVFFQQNCLAYTSYYPNPNSNPAPNPSQTQNTALDTSAIDVARLAALGAFNYDYNNFQRNLNSLIVYFTPSGWQSFMDALRASRNLDAVKSGQLTVTGRIIGEPKIISHTTVNNADQWVIEIPMTAVYADAQGRKLIHKMLVKLVLIPYVNKGNPYGIAIQQFIARPDAMGLNPGQTSPNI